MSLPRQLTVAASCARRNRSIRNTNAQVQFHENGSNAEGQGIPSCPALGVQISVPPRAEPQANRENETKESGQWAMQHF